jgi:hypothetical protein
VRQRMRVDHTSEFKVLDAETLAELEDSVDGAAGDRS